MSSFLYGSAVCVCARKKTGAAERIAAGCNVPCNIVRCISLLFFPSLLFNAQDSFFFFFFFLLLLFLLLYFFTFCPCFSPPLHYCRFNLISPLSRTCLVSTAIPLIPETA
ncbi:hypothetical protein LX32DRAFT_280773 [Colletotrichum zoysiae]|uniref:Uncharacterized protein n=1 Tax=Colletotrichum zoysiae TaxID=1216348 RepID=A0AAD9M7E0_9PEZI|nr:hypothetical protein LX32DRAFT_280773 [Colletotrichum zoysiae]